MAVEDGLIPPKNQRSPMGNWSRQAAARDIRTSLSEFDVEELDTYVGPVMVARAASRVLAAIHR